MVKMIWAQELSGGIGYQNKLPWHLPQEMQFFKSVTLNHVVVMGYNTFLCFNNKPLVNRTNIVLTTKQNLPDVSGFSFFHSVEDILKKFSNQDLYVIGGQKTYAAFLPYAQELIISKINASYPCDVYLKFDLADFDLINSEAKDGFNVEYYKRKA